MFKWYLEMLDTVSKKDSTGCGTMVLVLPVVLFVALGCVVFLEATGLTVIEVASFVIGAGFFLLIMCWCMLSR